MLTDRQKRAAQMWNMGKSQVQLANRFRVTLREVRGWFAHPEFKALLTRRAGFPDLVESEKGGTDAHSTADESGQPGR